MATPAKPKSKKSAKRVVEGAADVITIPLTAVSSGWLWIVRRAGLQRQPITRSLFRGLGLYPLRNQYYEPLFQVRDLPDDQQERKLPGIDLNVEGQLAWLKKFTYGKELAALPREESAIKNKGRRYFYHNPAYGSGDGEFLYSLIRQAKPKKVVEIGSGFSTLMAREAIEQNRLDDSKYQCEHICIEPYEMAWLEALPVKVIRQTVESLPDTFFTELSANDLLFIDSTHMIRRHGDVLHEYLHILPLLPSGVFVHVHDIFTPRDYPLSWLDKDFLFWNEQYLLEAFLSLNPSFKIIGALNYLTHHHFAAAAKAFPVLGEEPDREPGSFWMQRV